MRFTNAGLIPLALGLMAVAACAGGPPRGGPGGPRPIGAPLFISPFGEPFMAPRTADWPVKEWFEGADHDSDGVLTFAEFEADGLRWFGHLDRNGDGRLDMAELADYEDGLAGVRGTGRRSFEEGPEAAPGGPGGPPPRLNAAQPPQARGPGGRGRGRGQDRGERGYGRIAEAGFFNLPQPVKAADVNVDQRVTGEEWAQATQRWFLSLDIDRDGRLTLATLPKTPLQRRAEALGERR